MFLFDVTQLNRPIQTEFESHLCGDATLVLEDKGALFLALFDGAGHGIYAYQIAQIVLEFLRKNFKKSLDVILNDIHEYLRGTVGGVIGLCRIQKITGELEFSGVGNVVARVLSSDSKSLFNRGGILGYEMTNPKTNKINLEDGDVFLMYSDGIKSHFDLDEIKKGAFSADDISKMMISKYSKKTDDASIIVVKVGK